jgi:hypothetical protein
MDRQQHDRRGTATRIKAAEGDDAEQARLIDAQIEWINGLAEHRCPRSCVHRFNLIAPHVHGWNLADMDDGGDRCPPPRVDAAAALRMPCTPETRRGGCCGTTMQAYRLGFPIGSRQSGAQPEPTPEPSAGKPKWPAGHAPADPGAKSSSPDPSTFAA